MKECECGRLIPDSTNVCECGVSYRSGPPVPSKTKLCPYCKMSVPSDATVCGHCGQGIGTAHTVAAAIGLILGVVWLYGIPISAQPRKR
jgi:RNA polymerase subunit RPABC4/transcription elongation factor Spt4